MKLRRIINVHLEARRRNTHKNNAKTSKKYVRKERGHEGEKSQVKPNQNHPLLAIIYLFLQAKLQHEINILT